MLGYLFKARWPPSINIEFEKGYQTTRLTVAVDFQHFETLACDITVSSINFIA